MSDRVWLPELGPPDHLVFRLTHVENISFMLHNGIHCRSSSTKDKHFVQIGIPDLIDRRSKRVVPCQPGGTLADYVPFYFTPCSPMMYKITTGHGGVTRRSWDELALVVSSIGRLRESGVRHLIVDRHAILATAVFSEDHTSLDGLDWERLKARNFQRDRNDPGRFERYEAECLAYRLVPVNAFVELACATPASQDLLQRIVADAAPELSVAVRSHWFI